MKVYLAAFLLLVIPFFVFDFYCGWSGNGQLAIRGGFIIMFILVVACACAFVYGLIQIESRMSCRLFGYGICFILATAFTSFLVMNYASIFGRHCYWVTHKSELERIALSLLAVPHKTKVSGMATEKLKYPVFIHSDELSGNRFVVFSHWRTTAYRDIGFIYFPNQATQESQQLNQYVESYRELSPNWVIYSNFRHAH
jgi:hypothetical protein